MTKIIIDLAGGTRITIEPTPAEKPAEDLVNLSAVFGSVGKLDLADFDEPAEEKPRECQVVGCRRQAVSEIELIEDDGSRKVGSYCERHAQI